MRIWIFGSLEKITQKNFQKGVIEVKGSLKILVVSVLLMAMLGGVIAPAIAYVDPLNLIAIGSWIVNVFKTNPQKWMEYPGIGTVTINIAESEQSKMGGQKSFAVPLKSPNGEQAWDLKLISGWTTSVDIFFQVGKGKVKSAYYRFENEEPVYVTNPGYAVNVTLPQKDNKPHAVIIGVSTGGNSEGMVLIQYRYVSLSLAELIEQVLQNNLYLLAKEKDKEKQEGAAIVKILDNSGKPTAGTFTVRIEGSDGAREGKVTINQKTAQLGSTTVALDEDYTFKMNCIPQNSRVTFSREGKSGSVTREFSRSGQTETIILQGGM